MTCCLATAIAAAGASWVACWVAQVEQESLKGAMCSSWMILTVVYVSQVLHTSSEGVCLTMKLPSIPDALICFDCVKYRFRGS